MSETLLLPDVDNRSSLSLSILIGSPCAPERLKITAGHDTVSSAKWPVFFSPGSFAYYFACVRANLGWGGIRCSGVRNYTVKIELFS